MTTDTVDSVEATSPHVADLGAIDCDVHPRSPRQADLMPFLDAYWRDMFPYRDIDRMELTSYPASARPLTRPDAEGATTMPRRWAGRSSTPSGWTAPSST